MHNRCTPRQRRVLALRMQHNALKCAKIRSRSAKMRCEMHELNASLWTDCRQNKYRALTCLVHIEIQYGPTRIHTIFVLIRQQSRTGFGIRAAPNQSKASAAHSSMRSLLKHAMPSRLSMSCCTNCASVGRCPSGTPTSLQRHGPRAGRLCRGGGTRCPS